jgi:hypothetical protein
MADRTVVEEARSRIQTALCPRCASNVAVVGDVCPEGHGGLLEYRPDHPKQVRAAARPKRAVRISQAVVAAGVALFILGVALVPPAPPTTVVVEKPKSSDVSTPPAPAALAATASASTSASEATTPPAPKPTQPDPAAVAAASEKKQQQQAYMEFERAVYAAEKPATRAIKAFQKSAKAMAKGDATVLDVYSAVSDAKDECESVQSAYWDIEAPDTLPEDMRDMLGEAVQGLATTYMVKAEAFKAMGEYLDTQKPSKAQEFKEKMAQADSLTMDAVLKLTQAKERLDIPLTKK